MNKFEAVLLFSPEMTNSDLKSQENDFIKQLNNFKGALKNQEDWGLRDLSYKIKNNKKAFYRYYQIEIDGNQIQNIKKNLSQNELIMRHLFIKVSEHENLPTKLCQEKK